MPSEVVAGSLGEGRVASTADGGTALTTTAVCIRLPLITHHINMTPRNFSTAVVAKFHLNPWLTILKTTDNMATAPTDYSNPAQDLNAAAKGVVLSSLPTLANNGFLLVGAATPFRGVLVDVNDTNSAAASTLTVKYYNTSNVWTDITATDGTSDATRPFAVDGNVTWTVPTTWKRELLQNMLLGAVATVANGTGTMTGSPVTLAQGSNTPTVTVAGTFTVTLPTGVTGTARTNGWTVTDSPLHLSAGANTVTVEAGGSGTITIVVNPSSLTFPGDKVSAYWQRWTVSVALDSSVTCDRMLSLNRDSARYNELITGQVFEERVRHGESGGLGCIEALTNAGTCNIICNAFTIRDGGFVS